MNLAAVLDGVTVKAGESVLLDDISMTVTYGRVLALVGPNGAGKSTLLSVLTGDCTPTRGVVLLDQDPVATLSAAVLARRRAVLLQTNRVSFGYTVGQVIAMGSAPWRGMGRDEAAVISGAIQRAHVGHLVDREYGSLSGGEQARVTFARVLVQDAPVVMLDEPTAALDLRHQEELLSVARSLADEGRAVIVVLHDLSLAAAYADEMAMIARGRLVAVGEPAAVLTEERVAAVYQAPVAVWPDPVAGYPLVVPRRTRRAGGALP